MEQIEKVEGAEETLEVNAEQHDSEGQSTSDAPESDGQVLSDSEYQEYRKLKRLSEKSTKESSEENKEVGSNTQVEDLTFEVLGVTDDAARDLARKMVKLGEAKDLKEAVNSDLVQNKIAAQSANDTRKNATPPSSSRTPVQRKDTVEHWVDRDGLPADQDLRFKVIEARRAARGGKQMFGTPRNVVIK